jgi:glycosyltransferase involved in cell wall biosynthesis
VKIAHLYKDYHPPVRGGIEQTVERMARFQVRQGHDVTVIVSAHGGRRTVAEQVEGVHVIRVAEWARFASAPLCPGMPAAVRSVCPDIWHLHFPNPTGEVSYLLAAHPAPTVVTYHSDIVRQSWALFFYGPVVRIILKRADVIMPTSDAYIARSPFLTSNRERCKPVPLGIELDRFEIGEDILRSAATIRASYVGPIILFVGRLRYYKGLSFMIDAMQQAPGTLVVVGEGPMAESLRVQAKASGLESRVAFIGSVSDADLLVYVQAADIGVLPSTHPSEALGIALIEMMAGGLPVISTELGTGTSFVNLHDITGLVVPPRDAAALAGAVSRLARDPELRRKFSAAGRHRADQVFSTEAMMRAVSEAYGEATVSYRTRNDRGHVG